MEATAAVFAGQDGIAKTPCTTTLPKRTLEGGKNRKRKRQRD